MPVLHDVETPPRPPRRSWRDLPPSPPLGTPVAPPAPDTTALDTAEVPVDADPTAPQPMPGWGPPTAPPATDEGPRHRSWFVPAAIAVVIVLGIAAAAVWLTRDDGATTTGVSGDAQGSPAAIAEALSPAVVQIEVSTSGGEGVGSGVIYDTAGLVLTAHHVVADADEVNVKLADGSSVSGRVVGRQPERDLAVVALDGASDLTAARIAGADTVEVGEPVVALGSPFGFQASVTSGIVSGLDRELEIPGGETLTGLIQTDTAINPGNSGGPLADASATVIGINTAIASASGGSDGVGFAIPVEEAAGLMDTVSQAGGVDAPTVAAPEGGGGILDGLGGLVPDLGGSLPNLDDLLPDLGGSVPNLDELLPELQDLLPQLGDGSGSGSLDQLLQQLLDQLLGDQGSPDSQSAPGTAPSRSALGLIAVGELPDGYEVRSNTVQLDQGGSSASIVQHIVIAGPDGEVVIDAQLSPDAQDRVDAAGDDEVAWMLDDNLGVVVSHDGDVSDDDVQAIVDAVEVAR